MKTKIFSTKQGAMSVIDYYRMLTCLWTELDQYQNLQMACSKDASSVVDFVDKDKIFEFPLI